MEVNLGPPETDRALQQIVDMLASRLSRSVAVDAPDLHLLAASRHFGDEDSVRVQSLLGREVPPANCDYVMSFGVSRWTGPGRMAANEDFGAKARVCVPIRSHDSLLGYLWLIDSGVELTGSELADVEVATGQAAAVLYRSRILSERERAREEALLRDLVGGDPRRRRDAAEAIEAERLLAGSHRVVVLVVEVSVPDGAPGQSEPAIRPLLEQAGRSVPHHSALCLVEGTAGVLLLSGPSTSAEMPATTVADRIVSKAREALGPRTATTVGIGTTGALAAAHGSYEQASDAVRAATLLADRGPVVEWSQLGVYALLLRLPPHDESMAGFTASVSKLSAADPSGKLLATAEAFLEEAGDAVRTAARLQIHRTTLYYRLHRLEEVAGVDLRRGEDRTALHLGIKLARLMRTDEAEGSRPSNVSSA